MSESAADLKRRIEVAVASGYRERLLDKGLARGLIWREGKLPADAPSFPSSLTEDLLDYAHTVIGMSVRLRAQEVSSPILNRAFLVAGEAIEAAVHHGDGGPDRGFHRVSAAVAFHLARYSARAYSMLPAGAEAENLAPTERALVHLLRRKLEDMHDLFSAWLLDPEHSDERVADRYSNDVEFAEVDAVNVILNASFMRGLALFDHAITTGELASANTAKAHLIASAEAARDLHAVSHWWSATLASHLIDELWQLSLYQQIPILPDGDGNKTQWEKLRRSYIQRLKAGKRAAIELWPSQLQAAHRAVDPTDDLVVALPTSAGKTRIAELCILRALAANQRVIYVTPLRALSAQVERDLAEIFIPLGFTVSSLYGAAGVEIGDAKTLSDGKIVVSTPEKLDFALRNDESVIDDVGLIVLDEAHMLGPGEREVRYEALVQRLLRRDDAHARRVVCLSALFPTPDEMSDLVAWVRQDEPGDPVYSTWRPTRQRFGVLRWMSNAARLDVKVEEERPFVPRFIEAIQPPQTSRRRKTFPSDKNELTLAGGWRFVEQGKNVLIYCSMRRSVETLGRLALKCIEHNVLRSLVSINERVRNAMSTGTEWLGAHHPAVECLRYGVALHHGGLPRPFLNEVEHLMRSGDCPITIASPTLAQGLNLSASVLLVPSIWRKGEIIPTAEFANVAGRAGRAFVDLEGLVVHVVWEETGPEADEVVRKWEKLVDEAKAPTVVSGILQLTIRVCLRIAHIAGVAVEEVVDYVTGHSEAWDFSDAVADKFGVSAGEWDRDVASLDSAILALLNAETPGDDLETALDAVLKGSLFYRQLVQCKEAHQGLLRSFVAARAGRIWLQTREVQRKGYHAAGVGLSAGQYLDANLSVMVSLLGQAESSILSGDADIASTAVVQFAELAFRTAPFRTPKDLPARWKDALLAWIRGRSSAEVIGMCDDGVDLLQEALTYRLPWAMEAVRVYATAVGHEGADVITGLTALAVETGSSNRSVIVLMRCGLSSREAAMSAVASTGAAFKDRAGMLLWLRSDVVERRSGDGDWPTEESRHAWLRFREGQTKGYLHKWRREIQRVRVEWADDVPEAGTHVVIEPWPNRGGGVVLSPSFVPLGEMKSSLRRPRSDIVSACVGESSHSVEIEYFGPPVAS